MATEPQSTTSWASRRGIADALRNVWSREPNDVGLPSVSASEGSGADRTDEDDLFGIHGPTSTIPPVEKILVPPEEIRKQRIRWLLVVVAALALVGLTIKGVRHWIWLSDVGVAVYEASASGRPAAIDRALLLVDAKRSPGLDARLRAMAMLSGMKADGIQSLIDRADEADRNERLDARLAKLYLAVASGDQDAALATAASIRPAGNTGAEVAYAKALVGLSVGDLAHARAMGAESVRRSLGTPRHAALLVVILGRAGTLDEVQSVVASVDPSMRQTASLNVAQARVLLDYGEHREAMRLARSVANDPEATPSERAWAHLIRATVAADGGLRDHALAAAFDAEAASPPGDESFRLGLAETFLRVGDVEWAVKVRLRLPKRYSTNPERRNHLDAAIAFDKGLYKAALQALANESTSPQAEFLRGRVFERQGRTREAVRAFQRAAKDPRVGARARVRWAAVELLEGSATSAMKAIAPVLEELEGHPEFAPIAVDVFLAKGDREEANRIAAGVLALHPRDPRALGAAARVHIASEEWEQAVTLLQASLRADPDNVAGQTDLGRAAEALGTYDVARRAYETALRLEPSNREALVGVLGLYVLLEDPIAANDTLARLESIDERSRDVELLRAHTLVLNGQGHRGILRLQPAMSSRDRGGELYRALGELSLQAELYKGAAKYFETAARLGANPIKVAALIAQAHALDGNLSKADIAMEQLDRALSSADAKRGLSRAWEARLDAIRAWVEWAAGRSAEAERLARSALGKDSSSTDAHWLLSLTSAASPAEAKEHRYRAASGPRPVTDAVGMLALDAGQTETGCALARNYIWTAPKGRKAKQLRQDLRTCRKAGY